MDQEYKNTIMKEIDKLLKQVPIDKTNDEMNQYVNDYIYKSELLKRNLEHGICDHCRENSLSNCGNCELYLKKEELYKSIEFSSKLSKRNKRIDNLKKFQFFVAKQL